MNTKKNTKQFALNTPTTPISETTHVETVTPELAAQWLKRNARNRKLLMSVVDALVDAIQSDQWRVTHQGIAFGADGDLYDGQHRLHAIVKAQKAVNVRVTRGLPPEARDAIDTGTTRRAHDVLAITDGVVIGTDLRAAVVAAQRMATDGCLDGSEKGRLSVHGLRDALAEHGDDAKAILAAFHSAHGRITKAAMVGSLAIIHRTNPVKAIEFSDLVRSGENMAGDHPASVLRNFILLSYVATGGTSMEDLSLRTFGAFDAFLHGRIVKQLKRNDAARAKYLRPWRETAAAK